jgi:hypothetical protein
MRTIRVIFAFSFTELEVARMTFTAATKIAAPQGGLL